MKPAREHENQLLTRCAQVAQAASHAVSPDEANVFRLAAQLVKSRYPAAAANLESAGERFFQSHLQARKKRFPEVVQSGLVRDLPRFRNMLERQLKGQRTW